MIKKKLKLPILLLAVVVMMSIFYIHESKEPTLPVDGNGELEGVSLNPEYAESRIADIAEVNLLIEEKEELIASGNLSVLEIENLTKEINELKETKINEVALEEMLIEALSFDDVLVLLEGEYLVIDVYTNNDITAEVFISVTRLAKEKFDSNYKVKVIKTSIED